jgi:hypothetical protein
MHLVRLVRNPIIILRFQVLFIALLSRPGLQYASIPHAARFRSLMGPVVESTPWDIGRTLPFCRISSLLASRSSNATFLIAGIRSRHDEAPVDLISSGESALAASDGQMVLGNSRVSSSRSRCVKTGVKL